MFQSTKLFDGFSCVFRQWKAEGTHCRFLHGYGVSFRVWFEGELDGFKTMDQLGIIQLRVIPAVGAEQFAKFIFEKLNTFIQEETSGRVKVARVEFMEHSKNTAIYEAN